MVILTVGELRKQIASLPDDSPVFVADDYNYPKVAGDGYQCVIIAHDDNTPVELWIEFVPDALKVT